MALTIMVSGEIQRRFISFRSKIRFRFDQGSLPIYSFEKTAYHTDHPLCLPAWSQPVLPAGRSCGRTQKSIEQCPDPSQLKRLPLLFRHHGRFRHFHESCKRHHDCRSRRLLRQLRSGKCGSIPGHRPESTIRAPAEAYQPVDVDDKKPLFRHAQQLDRSSRNL